MIRPFTEPTQLGRSALRTVPNRDPSPSVTLVPRATLHDPNPNRVSGPERKVNMPLQIAFSLAGAEVSEGGLGWDYDVMEGVGAQVQRLTHVRILESMLPLTRNLKFES